MEEPVHLLSEYLDQGSKLQEYLLDVIRGKVEPINFQLGNASKKGIQENRQKIKPMTESGILYGRQRLSHHDHRGFGPLDILISIESKSEEGNFKAPLRYGIKDSDVHLVKHFETYRQNYTYV
ncbi:hypothetical protein NPIL_578421 [Nephila pilipes]|uniref:Uncharacterized protein n=1 Tax=Nephila pilipes TaxID=299642 RepID=A0A8X6TVA8_NEPPI|nr:hypothetical protein NPIL_578421 [Nephila pilipes]